MKRVIASIGLALAMAGSAQAQTEEKQVFACIEQAATGFHYDKDYRSTDFTPRNFTMVLDGLKLKVKLNDNEEFYTCTKAWSNLDILQCVERTYFMVVNLHKLRFNRSQMLGPIDGTEKADDMSVSYGSCQRF